LNGSSLNNIFPTSNQNDTTINALLSAQQHLNNTVGGWQLQNAQDEMQIVLILNHLQNMSNAYNCSATAPSPTTPITPEPAPSPGFWNTTAPEPAPNSFPVPSPASCDPCCQLDQLITTAEDLQGLYDNLQVRLDQLEPQVTVLRSSFDQIESSRVSFVNEVKQTFHFPDLTNNTFLLSSLQNDLGQCAWVGSFYTNIIQDALCSEISPAILWVGWSFAGVGLVVLALTLPVFWSLNLKTEMM